MKTFDGKIDTHPFPILSIKFFANRKFLKHTTEGFLYEKLRYCETKQYGRKIGMADRALILKDF